MVHHVWYIIYGYYYTYFRIHISYINVYQQHISSYLLLHQVIENLAYQVNVTAPANVSAPTNDQITGYMIDMIDAVAHKANFTYKLYMPSGMGAS